MRWGLGGASNIKYITNTPTLNMSAKSQNFFEGLLRPEYSKISRTFAPLKIRLKFWELLRHFANWGLVLWNLCGWIVYWHGFWVAYEKRTFFTWIFGARRTGAPYLIFGQNDSPGGHCSERLFLAWNAPERDLCVFSRECMYLGGWRLFPLEGPVEMSCKYHLVWDKMNFWFLQNI